MFKLWKIIKTAWHLVNHYHDDIELIKSNLEKSDDKFNKYRSTVNDRMDQHETVILHARDQIIERTTISADLDMHVRDNSASVIVIGRYRNADYVRVFSVRNSELNHTVDMLKGMEQSLLGRIRHVDAAPGFKASFMRDM